MEIKIQCSCGIKYKFEVEPVNGCVPFTVTCPQCGVDATSFANAHIQQMLGLPAPAAPAVTARVAPTEAAPEPAKPATAAATQPETRLRVHAQPTESKPAPAPAPRAAMAAAEPPPAARRITPAPAAICVPDQDEGLSPKFFLGLLGAALGVLVGCLVWYVIFHTTGKNLRLLAVIVGVTGGLGAKLLSKDEGSSQLGILTAMITLLGVVVTAYSIGRERVYDFAGGIEGTIYREQVAYAKRAVQAVPNGTEEEIRQFLAREEAEPDEKPRPETVRAAQVQHFRDVDLAHYKELASGQIREADLFKAQRRWDFEARVAEAKRTLEAMPNESDAEIRVYLAKADAEEDEKPDPKAVTAEEIKQFRAEVLPELKALASGEKQFEDRPEEDKKVEQVLTEVEAETPWMKFIYFLAGWGIGGVGILFVTLGLSYKISTHA